MYNLGIIPARMASTRYPGKPMEEVLGMPMIGHVYHRCRMATTLDEVWVATCDRIVHDYIVSIGGKAVMTADTHERASDRCSEAMLIIERTTCRRCDIMVMIQGDEPMVMPSMVDEALKPLMDDPAIQISNLLGRIVDQAEFEDPNQVKVVVDVNFDAMYFSREPIPSRKKFKGVPMMWKQVPIIPFRRDFLLRYNGMPQTQLEIVESVDMLRLVENGIKIRMVPTQFDTHAIDTPADLKLVEVLMRDDKLYSVYGGRDNGVSR